VPEINTGIQQLLQTENLRIGDVEILAQEINRFWASSMEA
jgi:hypothetical protein